MDMAPTRPHGGCLASWLYFHGPAEEDMLGCGVSLDHLRGMRLLPQWSETRPVPYNHREDLGRPVPESSLPGTRTEWGSQEGGGSRWCESSPGGIPGQEKLLFAAAAVLLGWVDVWAGG